MLPGYSRRRRCAHKSAIPSKCMRSHLCLQSFFGSKLLILLLHDFVYGHIPLGIGIGEYPAFFSSRIVAAKEINITRANETTRHSGTPVINNLAILIGGQGKSIFLELLDHIN